MVDKKMLALRKEIKARKPAFRKQDSHKKSRLTESWRKPRGLQSKMRMGFYGKPVAVEVGYRSPVSVRGLDRSGLAPVLVYSLAELDKIDVKSQGVILGHIGARKRAILLDACSKKKISVLNFKDISGTLKSIEESFASRKSSRAVALKEKQQKAPEASKAVKDNKKEEKVEVSEKDQKDSEKKEKDKIITKRD